MEKETKKAKAIEETIEETIEESGLEIQSTFNEDEMEDLLEEGEIVDVCEEN